MKFRKNILIALFVIILLLIGITLYNTRDAAQLIYHKSYDIVNIPKLARDIFLGGFSDLYYKDGFLYTVTDSGDGLLNENSIPLHKFKPRIVQLQLKNRNLIIRKIIILPIFGTQLPQSTDTDSYQSGVPLKINLNGADAEALVIDKNGCFWLGESYFPSVIKLDPTGNILSRFAPENHRIQAPGISYTLPEEFNKMPKNFGFDAIAYDRDNYLYIFTQSPLAKGKYIKIIKFDISTNLVDEIFNYNAGKNNNVTAAAFIGENTILTVEKRNNDTQIRKLNLSPKKAVRSKKLISLNTVPGINSDSKIKGITFDGANRVFIINDNDCGLGSVKNKTSFITELTLVYK